MRGVRAGGGFMSGPEVSGGGRGMADRRKSGVEGQACA